jgi:large subunit ribosomal protein L24
MLIRKNDLVVVITGDDKPAWSAARPRRVLKTDPRKNRVYVEGINFVWRHVRPSRKYPQGGRVQKEAPIQASNIMLWCDSCARGVRVTGKIENGRKIRVCRKCGKGIQVRKT